MSHGLLADSVDTSLVSLLYSCTTDAVLSEGHDAIRLLRYCSPEAGLGQYKNVIK